MHHFRFALNILAVYTKKYNSYDHGQSFLKPCQPQAKVSQIMLIKRNKFTKMWTPLSFSSCSNVATLLRKGGNQVMDYLIVSPFQVCAAFLTLHVPEHTVTRLGECRTLQFQLNRLIQNCSQDAARWCESVTPALCENVRMPRWGNLLGAEVDRAIH